MDRSNIRYTLHSQSYLGGKCNAPKIWGGNLAIEPKFISNITKPLKKLKYFFYNKLKYIIKKGHANLCPKDTS